MEQRTILELILGVYKLDKKYRSSPHIQQKKQKIQKPKYVPFTQLNKMNESFSSSALDESDNTPQQDDSSLSQLSDNEIGSVIDIDDNQDYSDSDEIQCFALERQYVNGTRFHHNKSISTLNKPTTLLEKSYSIQNQFKMLVYQLSYELPIIEKPQRNLLDSSQKHTDDQMFKTISEIVNTTNIGLIQQKILIKYMGQLNSKLKPYHLYYPQLGESLQQVMIDYIIQAYSYDFSIIRVQQNNIMIRLTSIVNNLIEDFDMSKEDEELVEQIQHSIQQIEKRNQEIRVKTMFCCGRVMQNHSDKFVICSNCGRMCNYQKKSIRKDRNEGSQRNTSYHSIRHFDDVFKQLFIQPLEPIDSITKLQLQEFMERDHKQKVNIEDVRQYLKQLPGGKGSKLNKSDAFIMGLLNGETLKITNIEYQFIKNTFQQFIQILYKNAEIRKNTPNCVSFIRKIIDLLYKDLDPIRHQQIVKRLHQQKENTTRKMQKTWQFLLSQFDVSRIKQEFKDTIKGRNPFDT